MNGGRKQKSLSNGRATCIAHYVSSRSTYRQRGKLPPYKDSCRNFPWWTANQNIRVAVFNMHTERTCIHLTGLFVWYMHELILFGRWYDTTHHFICHSKASLKSICLSLGLSRIFQSIVPQIFLANYLTTAPPGSLGWVLTRKWWPSQAVTCSPSY